MQEKLLFTPEQAADFLSISRSMVFKLLSDGELGSVKIGRSRRIPRVVLEEYVERLRVDGGKRS